MALRFLLGIGSGRTFHALLGAFLHARDGLRFALSAYRRRTFGRLRNEIGWRVHQRARYLWHESVVTALHCGHFDFYGDRHANRFRIPTSFGGKVKRQQLWIAFFSGVIFAIGLAASGMTQPQKVLGFLDIAGKWDPSLLFVMVGALAVYALGFRYLTKNGSKPLYEKKFELPTKKKIDGSLMAGSALFGLGWGLVGYCPGPALVSLAAFRWEPTLFCLSMFAGMALFDWNRGKKR